MLKCFKNFDAKKTGLFAAGVLFGTAGIKILSSKDAKKLYTNCTAAVLRAKEVVLKTATKVQENAEDIYAEAKQINEDRAAAEEHGGHRDDGRGQHTERTGRAAARGRRGQILDQGRQGPDHPAHPAMVETEYLKSFLLRLVQE